MRPENIIFDDLLYVKYDVRVQGEIIIPRGTKVKADWITEIDPPEVQLQTTFIYLQGRWQPFYAFSPVYQSTREFDGRAVRYADTLYRKPFQSVMNVKTDLITTGRKTSAVPSNYADTTYLEINVREIPVIVDNSMEETIAQVDVMEHRFNLCPQLTCPPLGAIDPYYNKGNFNQPRTGQRSIIYEL